MGAFDFVIVIFLLGVLGLGVYVLYQYWPSEPVEYEEFAVSYQYNASERFNVSGNVQFYSSMRYRDRAISYFIEETCNQKKREDVLSAFATLSERSILTFYQSQNEPEIAILCSQIAPKEEEKGHFVAGEGGPSEVISVGAFHVIFNGKVSLFRTDRCDTPQIALHEILHALGYEHNVDEKSIMYPVTNCDQILDDYIVEDINRLYRIESKADLIVENVSVSKIGRYLDFKISILNGGLKDVGSARLILKTIGEKIGEFNLGSVDIGTRRVLTAENVRAPRTVDSLEFSVVSNADELSFDNNRAVIGVA